MSYESEDTRHACSIYHSPEENQIRDDISIQVDWRQVLYLYLLIINTLKTEAVVDILVLISGSR